jgi:abortive infection bacteriophage resistance protein
VAYTKPHLSYEDQLALLMRRGLVCRDCDRALALLRSVGYYRLSAYVYPFRVMLPDEEQCVTSPVHYRYSDLQPGTTFEQVEDLWKFDRRLRLRILDGLELVEIGLRTQVAHILGRRNPFGHLDRDSLDEDACKIVRGDDKRDQFEMWTSRYDDLERKASREDFVRHHIAKYGRPLPIWVAVEFLDFGAIVRLFGLLDRADQNEVALELGVKGGRLLDAWLTGLNYLRNTAAHHSRTWNRALTYKVRSFHPGQVTDPSIRHIADSPVRDKVYLPLAVTAYLVRHIDPANRWPVNLRDDVKKFPDLPNLSPVQDMGFPEGWMDLALWKVP